MAPSSAVAFHTWSILLPPAVTSSSPEPLTAGCAGKLLCIAWSVPVFDPTAAGHDSAQNRLC